MSGIQEKLRNIQTEHSWTGLQLAKQHTLRTRGGETTLLRMTERNHYRSAAAFRY